MKILITGTTQGIGKAIAEKFLKEGHEVIGIDRQKYLCRDYYQSTNKVKAQQIDEERKEHAGEEPSLLALFFLALFGCFIYRVVKKVLITVHNVLREFSFAQQSNIYPPRAKGIT